MSVESIIFFLLALFVWGISVAARWFQEQMNSRSTDGIEFEPIDWSSSSDFEAESQSAPLVQPEVHQRLRPLPSVPKNTVPRKELVKRFGLDRPQTLRQGIILMTVLGPCRALEPSKDSRSF